MNKLMKSMTLRWDNSTGESIPLYITVLRLVLSHVFDDYNRNYSNTCQACSLLSQSVCIPNFSLSWQPCCQ